MIGCRLRNHPSFVNNVMQSKELDLQPGMCLIIIAVLMVYWPDEAMTRILGDDYNLSEILEWCIEFYNIDENDECDEYVWHEELLPERSDTVKILCSAFDVVEWAHCHAYHLATVKNTSVVSSLLMHHWCIGILLKNKKKSMDCYNAFLAAQRVDLVHNITPLPANIPTTTGICSVRKSSSVSSLEILVSRPRVGYFANIKREVIRFYGDKTMESDIAYSIYIDSYLCD